jgi:hypothetical protein
MTTNSSAGGATKQPVHITHQHLPDVPGAGEYITVHEAAILLGREYEIVRRQVLNPRLGIERYRDPDNARQVLIPYISLLTLAKQPRHGWRLGTVPLTNLDGPLAGTVTKITVSRPKT